MGKAKKLPSGNWRTLVYSHTEKADGKSKRIYKSFTSEDRKESEYLAAQYARNRNTSSSVTLKYGDALDKYIENRSSVLSPSTIREYKRSRRCDLQSLMDIRVCDLAQDKIQEAVNMESIKHSPKSVRNMHGLLSAVLGAYRPDFALHTDLPKKVRPNIYVPSDSEIQRLMEVTQGTEMEIPILLAAFGPMRRGEICALDSDHIKGNTVHVEFAMVMDENKEWVIKEPKSYAGNRYIDFPDFVIKQMEGIKGRIVNLNPANITDRFVDIIKKHEMNHFRFHDLRHYNASVSHALGVPDQYIMARGGWGNDAVLKSVYRHVMNDKTAQNNEAINSHFDKLCNTKCNTK